MDAEEAASFEEGYINDADPSGEAIPTVSRGQGCTPLGQRASGDLRGVSVGTGRVPPALPPAAPCLCLHQPSLQTTHTPPTRPSQPPTPHALPPPVLRFLIASREEVGSQQLRDDLLSMLVAGHETTGSVLTWTLDLLARNPEQMKKVRHLEGTARVYMYSVCPCIELL